MSTVVLSQGNLCNASHRMVPGFLPCLTILERPDTIYLSDPHNGNFYSFYIFSDGLLVMYHRSGKHCSMYIPIDSCHCQSMDCIDS